MPAILDLQLWCYSCIPYIVRQRQYKACISSLIGKHYLWGTVNTTYHISLSGDGVYISTVNHIMLFMIRLEIR